MIRLSQIKGKNSVKEGITADFTNLSNARTLALRLSDISSVFSLSLSDYDMLGFGL